MWPLVPASFITACSALGNFRTDVIVTPCYSHLDFNVTRPLVSDRVGARGDTICDRPPRRWSKDGSRVRHRPGEYGSPKRRPIRANDIRSCPTIRRRQSSCSTMAGWKRRRRRHPREERGSGLSLQFPYYTGSASAEQQRRVPPAELQDRSGSTFKRRKYRARDVLCGLPSRTESSTAASGT